jgi:hypothetical protein
MDQGDGHADESEGDGGMPMITIMIVLLGILLGPALVSATSCSRGTDCYADCVRGPATVGAYKNAACQAKFSVGVPVDTALLWVEDFEAPTLHDNVSAGGGAPNYGPPYDATGIPGDRGRNSYWFQTYSNGVNSVIWARNEPTSPTLGAPCTAFDLCVGLRIWHPQNLWNANGQTLPGKVVAVVLKNGEFNAEIGSITPPTGSAGGGSGVFDGQQTWGYRMAAGWGQDGGIIGRKAFAQTRTLGMTMALAYASNIGSANIVDAWKHNEWETVLGGGGGDGLFAFGLSGAGTTPFHFPFYGFMVGDVPGTGWSPTQLANFEADCNTAKNAASLVVGIFNCTSVNFNWTTQSSAYNRATDWPFGTWGCLEAHYQNIGLSNAQWQVYFTGPAGVRKKVIDIQNFNMTWGGANGFATNPPIQSKNGYQALNWNNYYNGNYNGNPPGPLNSTQTTFRYEDNFHIRAGAPVSCAQIGFASTGGGPTPPAAPTGLRFASLAAVFIAAGALIAWLRGVGV